MRRLTAVLSVTLSVTLSLTLLVATAGCERPQKLAGPSPSAPTSPGPAATEWVAIYLAVLREYLSPGVDASPGNPTPGPLGGGSFYLLDTADTLVFNPTGAQRVELITAAEQAAIRAGVADLGRVELIPSRGAVVQDVGGCQQVRDNGVLLALSPPIGGPDRVEVGLSAFRACLNAVWLRYTAVRDGFRWRVTDMHIVAIA